MLEGKNFFEIFNLPTSYNINVEHLNGQFLILQKTFHPDINPAFAATSSLINIAHATLKDNFSRAAYLIKICCNFDIGNETNSSKYKLPAAFLEEIFELSIQLQSSISPTELAKITQQIHSRLNLIHTELTTIASSPNLIQQNQTQIIDLLYKHKYLNNLLK